MMRQVNPMGSLFIDDMFEKAFRDPFSLLEGMRPALKLNSERLPSSFSANNNYDVEETDQGLLLSIDLPGVKKEDLSINVTENVLTVSAERKTERNYGRYQKSFNLPSTINAEKVEAHLEDGVLQIALPKLEQAKPRTIQVQSGKGGFFSQLIGIGKKDDKEMKEAKASQAH